MVLALAAVCQCARLVNDIAGTGKCEWEQATPLLDSVLATDAPDVVSVFGGIANVRTGLLTLVDQLNMQHGKRDANLSRYLAALFNIERQLARNSAMQDTIRTRVLQSQRLRTHMPDEWDALVTSLAGIYTDTISTLPLRIQVRGDARHLQVKENQNRIRALLLAGVRCAVLWRQLGGKRRQFLLARAKILHTAQALLRA